jgi:hypothetical protein
MNSQDFRNLQEAYSQVYQLDENRMASRMEKMPTPPAKVGKATHSIKDLVPSKPPTPEEKAKARKALGLNEISNAKVAAVSKARQKNVNKAFDKLDDSRVSSQNLATAISKQQKNQRLSSKRDKRNEEVDLYDIILSHLLDEGYADTQEAAEAIMVNMSEEWRDDISELYKGKHGQSETEYQAGRSDAGKRVSGDENTGPRHYALGRSARPDAPTKPGEKPKNTPKLANWEKDDIQYRKANLKK